MAYMGQRPPSRRERREQEKRERAAEVEQWRMARLERVRLCREVLAPAAIETFTIAVERQLSGAGQGKLFADVLANIHLNTLTVLFGELVDEDLSLMSVWSPDSPSGRRDVDEWLLAVVDAQAENIGMDRRIFASLLLEEARGRYREADQALMRVESQLPSTKHAFTHAYLQMGDEARDRYQQECDRLRGQRDRALMLGTAYAMLEAGVTGETFEHV